MFEIFFILIIWTKTLRMWAKTKQNVSRSPRRVWRREAIAQMLNPATIPRTTDWFAFSLFHSPTTPQQFLVKYRALKWTWFSWTRCLRWTSRWFWSSRSWQKPRLPGSIWSATGRNKQTNKQFGLFHRQRLENDLRVKENSISIDQSKCMTLRWVGRLKGICICICVFVYLCICVFVYLRICVFVYLWICVFVNLCIC